MKLSELKLEIDKRVKKYGDYDVIYRVVIQDPDQDGYLRITDTFLDALTCDDETETFNFLSLLSYQVYDDHGLL